MKIWQVERLSSHKLEWHGLGLTRTKVDLCAFWLGWLKKVAHSWCGCGVWHENWFLKKPGEKGAILPEAAGKVHRDRIDLCQQQRRLGYSEGGGQADWAAQHNFGLSGKAELRRRAAMGICGNRCDPHKCDANGIRQLDLISNHLT